MSTHIMIDQRHLHRDSHEGERAKSSFILLMATLCLSAVPVTALTTSNPPNEGLFRLAFTIGMFPETNKSDAKAAVKIWAETLAASKGERRGK